MCVLRWVGIIGGGHAAQAAVLHLLCAMRVCIHSNLRAPSRIHLLRTCIAPGLRADGGAGRHARWRSSEVEQREMRRRWFMSLFPPRPPERGEQSRESSSGGEHGGLGVGIDPSVDIMLGRAPMRSEVMERGEFLTPSECSSFRVESTTRDLAATSARTRTTVVRRMSLVGAISCRGDRVEGRDERRDGRAGVCVRDGSCGGSVTSALDGRAPQVCGVPCAATQGAAHSNRLGQAALRRLLTRTRGGGMWHWHRACHSNLPTRAPSVHRQRASRGGRRTLWTAFP